MSILAPEPSAPPARTEAEMVPPSAAPLRPRIILPPLVGMLALAATLMCLEAAWQLTTPSPYLPRPSQILTRAFLLVRDGPLLADAQSTLTFIAVGVGLATVLGFLVALACHAVPAVRWALTPLIELTRGIAPLALIPLFMLMFGIGPASKIAITVWVAWTPVFINCLEGFSTVDPSLLKVVRSLGARPWHVTFEVILPSSAPFLVSGIRLAFGAAFLAVVASEMFGSTRGLGFFILDASQTFHIVDMYAAIAVVGVLGWSINAILLQTGKHLARWRLPSP